MENPSISPSLSVTFSNKQIHLLRSEALLGDHICLVIYLHNLFHDSHGSSIFPTAGAKNLGDSLKSSLTSHINSISKLLLSGLLSNV